MNKIILEAAVLSSFFLLIISFHSIEASAESVTIDGILMHDDVNKDNPEDEPQSYEAVEKLFNERPEDRTGYSLTLYRCTPGSSDPGGWYPENVYQTADASENPKWYDPAQYKDIIIEKTDQETYDALIASGEMFRYDADNGYNSINGTPFDTRVERYPCPYEGATAYHYNNNEFYLTVTFEMPDDNPGGGDGGNGPACHVTTSTQATDTIESDSKDMDTDPIGEINEDDSSGSNIFNVMDYSIPTDEYLDTYGETKRYLMDYKFQKYEGTITYTVEVDRNYNLKWKTSYTCGSDENPRTCWESHSDKDHKMLSFKDTYNYSFWQIGHLVFYEFDNFEFDNYALPNQHVTVINNEHETAIDAVHSAIWEKHVQVQPCNNVTLSTKTVDLGKSNRKPSSGSDYFTSSEKIEFEEAAERHTRQPEVTNDFVELETESDRDETRGGEKINDQDIDLEDYREIHMSDEEAVCNGTTNLLDDSPMDCFTEDATELPSSDIVDLYRNGYYIDAEKVNNYKTRSEITANYERIININKSPSRTKSFTNDSDGRDINTVTVHTPVVMYSRSSDDKEHDQRINPPLRSTPANPDIDRHAYILDRPFTVWLPTNGQHLDYPGYGERDYLKYYKNKQVKFPFDVYSETKAAFYPANTWINVPPDMQQVTFFLPVWVPEGEYTVDYRAFAINYPGATYPYEVAEGGEQHEKNTTIPNSEYNVPPAGTQSAAHTVYDSIEVDVVGRLYDFHITDIMDYNWKNTFRNQDGLTPTGNSYWVGLNGIDGQFSLG
ncbi:hypothetical protein CD30_00900 [Ureibacillus massiliensis 4400831 = CIP 108448 = CCUG 49529]|uniref:DUF5704 domain-containing protein n=1 Tax=Ureibacillus massiliensis 4400831 = CIP 108448 = CCUG 49529 TaxID=1211035 RepID=A0A0A3J9E8_9BACL|nr:DUF5704 domain-containing protein [Ureibacillus massiliensis]KGR92400.1 hypothetical protein CD30_00900 [Ureibacillus massiliensis 4400831 = CIP 108448 = CCUG 49529]